MCICLSDILVHAVDHLDYIAFWACPVPFQFKEHAHHTSQSCDWWLWHHLQLLGCGCRGCKWCSCQRHSFCLLENRSRMRLADWSIRWRPHQSDYQFAGSPQRASQEPPCKEVEVRTVFFLIGGDSVTTNSWRFWARSSTGLDLLLLLQHAISRNQQFMPFPVQHWNTVQHLTRGVFI